MSTSYHIIIRKYVQYGNITWAKWNYLDTGFAIQACITDSKCNDDNDDAGVDQDEGQ